MKNLNLLFCSAGKHGRIITYIKESLKDQVKIVATSNNRYIPALYCADKSYILPDVKSETYLQKLLEICEKENINAITTMLDVETEILSKNRNIFESKGIMVFVPYYETAKVCFDKYEMYKAFIAKGIKTILTYDNINDFEEGRKLGKIDFPVFVKPRKGRGSVGARKIENIAKLLEAYNDDNSLIIQEYICGDDIDVDVYVDAISKQPSAIFSKRKLMVSIGGTIQSISFIDKTLNEVVKNICAKFDFCGPIDMEFFKNNDSYILTEINPRFGAAVIHAFGCKVDFAKFMYNNINNIENKNEIGLYSEDVIMMKYDSAIIIDKDKLAKEV